MDPRNHLLDGGTDPACKGAVMRGEDMSGCSRRHPGMSCAKMAEFMDLPLRLWTWVG